MKSLNIRSHSSQNISTKPEKASRRSLSLICGGLYKAEPCGPLQPTSQKPTALNQLRVVKGQAREQLFQIINLAQLPDSLHLERLERWLIGS